MTRPQDNFNWAWHEFRVLVWLLCAFLTLVVGVTWIVLS